jgi:hypothetical protein
MNEAERINRLTEVLKGTGSTVIHAFRINALDSELADHHIAQMTDWAELEFLLASRTKITDASVNNICRFRNLTCLCIGGNAITSSALADCDLPRAIEDLGLYSISLADDAIAKISRCVGIRTLNVNHCNLSNYSLERLSGLSNLEVIEALGADSTPATSKLLSNRYPKVLFRLRDGVWQDGQCRRQPSRFEQA